MIPFNRPPLVGTEASFIEEALASGKLSGDGLFGKRCQRWFEESLPCAKAFFTPSCTHALEMAAILIGIEPGDEVIMPSYTFVSTANAFVLRGATIVFVDVRSDTLNLDEAKIESAITDKTKAIVPVHYAGVGCEMDVICKIAEKHGLFVVEDAAQGMMSTFKGRSLSTLGHLAALSFHETKNYTSGGEGGLLVVNDARFSERAEIIREKGTNRSQFFRGAVDKYTWVDVGSSYLPSELQAAFLWAQLENADLINSERLKLWRTYHRGLESLEISERLVRPEIPAECQHNAHMYHIRVRNLDERTRLIEHLKQDGIQAAFHYVPLHTSPAGRAFGRFNGEDEITTKESEKLLRLPLWYGMSEEEVDQVVDSVKAFFK